MNTELIYECCEVVKEVRRPIHAIFFKEDENGYADIETSEGVISYSCGSVEEFDALVELSVGD